MSEITQYQYFLEDIFRIAIAISLQDRLGNELNMLKTLGEDLPFSIGPSVWTIILSEFKTISACNNRPTSNGSGAYVNFVAPAGRVQKILPHIYEQSGMGSIYKF